MSHSTHQKRTLDDLPVKFLYSYQRKAMQVFYRKKNNHNLFSKFVPYNHYIFTEVNNTDDVDGPVYKHLVNGRRYKKEYIDYKKAKALYTTFPEQTAEADLRPENRFVIDNYYDVEWPSDIKPRIFYYDIETEIVGDEIPTFTNNKANITAFTIYDTYTETYYLRALVPVEFEYTNIQDLTKEIEASLDEFSIKHDVKLYTNNEDIIDEIINFFTKMPPDIVTSWNSPFDIPYTVRKVFDYRGEDGLKALSPFGKIDWQVRQCLEENKIPASDSLIPGVSVVDDLRLYKKYTASEKTSYTLDSVSHEELKDEGEGKLHYDTDLDTLYKQDFVYFCKYNVQDVRVMVLIEAKLKLLDLTIAVRNLTKANYEHIFTELNLVDNMCLMKIHRWRENDKNWVLPSKPTIVVKEPYLGAYVKPTIQGRYKWVGDLDYKSEYPSAYDTFGISPETMVGMIDNFMQVLAYGFKEIFPELEIDEIIQNILPGFKNYRTSEIITIKPCPMYSDIPTTFGAHKNFIDNYKDFKEWCIANDYIIAGNGMIIDRKCEEPFLGTLAGDTMDLRDEYKVLMKKYDAEGNEALALIFNISQGAVKVINNSIYGVTAAGAFRLFDIRIAEGITATGQCIIKSSTYMVNRKVNEVIRSKYPDREYRDVVLTNDTDSIIFTVEDLVNYPIDTTDVEKYKKVVALINKLGQETVNNGIKDVAETVFFINRQRYIDGYKRFRLFIKNEWVASSGLFMAKKCYALNIVFKEGYPKKDFKVVGMTLKKSSTPKATQDFLANIVKRILSFDDKANIDKTVLDEAIKLKTYNYEDLAVPMSVNGIDSYTHNVPVHVRGAKVFNKYFAKSKKDNIVNEKVKYLYVGQWLTQPDLNLEKAYVITLPTNKKEYWEHLSEWVVPDYTKLRTNLILKPIDALYKALHWEMPNIMRADIKSSFAGFKKKCKKSKEIEE